MSDRDDRKSDSDEEVAHQPGQPPVIEDHSLPTMAPVGKVRAARAGGSAGASMGRRPTADSGGGGRMGPVPRQAGQAKPMPARGFADQQRVAGPKLADSPLSYIRLRMHFESGALSVVGAREVPGPLTVPDYVSSGLAYEVLADNRRIGLGSLPDANQQRAFTNADREEAALGHNTTILQSYDFDVRIPRSELSVDALQSVQIHLHQINQAPSQPLGSGRLRAQMPEAVETVATLAGINLGQLQPAARTELAQILGARLADR